MGKVKKFFSDINKSKFKSLYVKNFLFAVSILIVVLFAAITFNDIWLNIIGIFVLFGFSYLTFNVRAIEQNKLYEEVTGVITGYKEKAKAASGERMVNNSYVLPLAILSNRKRHGTFL